MGLCHQFCPPCRCPPPCHPPPRCLPSHCRPPYSHHHHEANALDVLAKTPVLYLFLELRYPCHRCRPCRCPPPRRHPPCCHHHVVNVLDFLDIVVKTPGLYLVLELRYLCHHCCHV